ncbi:hypothetical protein PTKIN_Ptkin08bG0154100 [Pterospermum kingtungense]
MNIGICDAFQAELWAVVQGLELAWNHGVRRLIVEMDSKVDYEFLSNGADHFRNSCNLKYRWLKLLKRNWEVEVRFIYREANRSADFLARLGLSLDLGTKVFSIPPDDMLQVLQDDARGLAFPRTIRS